MSKRKADPASDKALREGPVTVHTPSPTATLCQGCGEEMYVVPDNERQAFIIHELPDKSPHFFAQCERVPVVYSDYFTADGRRCCSGPCVGYAERGEVRANTYGDVPWEKVQWPSDLHDKSLDYKTPVPFSKEAA